MQQGNATFPLQHVRFVIAPVRVINGWRFVTRNLHADPVVSRGHWSQIFLSIHEGFFFLKKKKKKKRKRNDSFRKYGRLHYGIFAYRFPEPVPS